jgi:maleate isomerase
MPLRPLVFREMIHRSEELGEESMPNGPLRLGMLTPSSNTVLEPLTYRILADHPDVSVHFSRLTVRTISLGEASRGQFDTAPMVEAARLLADAKVDAIAWNGTSASWLGLETDRRLCERITAETGVPATSAILSQMEAFRANGVRRYGLVTPYVAEVQRRIVENWAGEGLECAADARLDIEDNFAFAEVAPETLAAMVRNVARSRPDAIAIVCTNLAGAGIAEALEQETGIPVHDSVAVTLWGALGAARRRDITIAGWGRLLAQRTKEAAAG